MDEPARFFHFTAVVCAESLNLIVLSLFRVQENAQAQLRNHVSNRLLVVCSPNHTRHFFMIEIESVALKSTGHG